MSSTRMTADCRPASAVVTRWRCTVVSSWAASSVSMASARSALGVTRTLAAISSCSAWLIKSATDMRGVGGVVGQDGDLGWAGFGVDTDSRAAKPFGRGDVDVAGPGDHVDR